MLSGEFESVPYDFIWVNRSERIRTEITEESILEKAESIQRLGLIHPPVIKRDGELIAGETRWMALGRLGWDRVPIQWSDTLDNRELLAIEIEENIKRTDLSWKDQCSAMLRYHELQKEIHGDSWSQESTAEAIGINQGTVAKHIAVAKELASGNERVMAAKEKSVAIGITRRMTERRKSDELSNIKLFTEDEPDASAPPAVPVSPILTADFLSWVETYSGPSFNFIHCDFPYGINADKFNQGASDAYGGYEDSPEIYWALMGALLKNKEKLLGSSGHILFWFSQKYYTETLAALREHFWVDPYPLIWVKSDSKGTLPDPERGPRRVYEVAFLCSHGDRKILSPVANAFAAPTVRTGEHMSEKNPDMLKHFMRMIVDEHTRLLDPTCGSGSALRAASSLGCINLLGLELNPEFAESARRAWDLR